MKRVSLLRSGYGSCPDAPDDPSPALMLRLRVRLHCRRLDHQLADGLVPDGFDDRELRARQLAGAGTRRRLACSLRGLVQETERPAAGLLSSAVPVCRRTVWPWREGLLGLAERLERPDPINPCGVARILVLLTDGAGPLYNQSAERSMSEAVWWIADGLQLCPPNYIT